MPTEHTPREQLRVELERWKDLHDLDCWALTYGYLYKALKRTTGVNIYAKLDECKRNGIKKSGIDLIEEAGLLDQAIQMVQQEVNLIMKEMNGEV